MDHTRTATGATRHPAYCHPSYCAPDGLGDALHGSEPAIIIADDADIELNLLGDSEDLWVRLAVESRRRTTGPGSNALLFCSIVLTTEEAVELRDRLTAALALGGVA